MSFPIATGGSRGGRSKYREDVFDGVLVTIPLAMDAHPSLRLSRSPCTFSRRARAQAIALTVAGALPWAGGRPGFLVLIFFPVARCGGQFFWPRLSGAFSTYARTHSIAVTVALALARSFRVLRFVVVEVNEITIVIGGHRRVLERFGVGWQCDEARKNGRC